MHLRRCKVAYVCLRTIDLTSFIGVVTAKVSLMTERAEIVFLPSLVSTQALVDEVEAVGFEARWVIHLIRTLTF